MTIRDGPLYFSMQRIKDEQVDFSNERDKGGVQELNDFLFCLKTDAKKLLFRIGC